MIKNVISWTIETNPIKRLCKLSSNMKWIYNLGDCEMQCLGKIWSNTHLHWCTQLWFGKVLLHSERCPLAREISYWLLVIECDTNGFEICCDTCSRDSSHFVFSLYFNSFWLVHYFSPSSSPSLYFFWSYIIYYVFTLGETSYFQTWIGVYFFCRFHVISHFQNI